MNPASRNKRKIINDPVHGFVTIPSDLLFDLIEHPLYQRLRRIRQLGLTSYVYPGALHTRFHHAIGAMHLTCEAIDTLRLKGFDITPEEAEATLAAILLHDIGHGPYSHALEYSIVSDTTHEDLSLLMMQKLNRKFGGKLDQAIAIFSNSYPKHFLHQLVSGQLDMDRLDYLKRDSYYTGVSEGVINSERIIRMLTVHDDELMVEDKGIYSIEKFIVARRLMYWQVYYHKTVVAAESMLINLMKRAKVLAQSNHQLFATPPLEFFLKNNISRKDFAEDEKVIGQFALLDDYDLFASIKVWAQHDDFILSALAKGLVNRQLFKIRMSNEPFHEAEIEQIAIDLSHEINLPLQIVSDYLISTGNITNNAYNPLHDKIKLLYRDGKVVDISESSDQLNISILTSTVTKHYLTYPKSNSPIH